MVPPLFVDLLARQVLERQVTLSLHAAFHLRCNVSPRSSATTVIFGFYSSDTKLAIQHVRKSDNDVHTIDLVSKQVTYKYCHWMGGTTESQEPIDSAWAAESGQELLERWFSPKKWLNDGRAAIVRPSDGASSTVPLCGSSVRALAQGRTLLLIKGDLIHVPSPGKAKVYLAGLTWRESSGTTASEITFLLAERATRPDASSGSDGSFDGRVDWKPERSRRTFDPARPDRPSSGLFTEERMFDWQPYDEYRYIAGSWASSA